jgi:hypothetical protein
MYFLFDEVGLLIVLVGSFFGGFLPLLILLMITPEAREHIKCRIMGGIMVLKFWDTGQCEYTVAQEKGGEGQYIAGKNKFGQREIYVKPRVPAPFMVKPFLLKGMRRLIYFCYAGKTPIVNPETLMAIETVEAPTRPITLHPQFRKWANEKYPAMLQDFDKEANNGGSNLRQKDLSPDVIEWAEQNGIYIQEDVFGAALIPKFSEPDKSGISHYVGNEKVRKVIGQKDVFHNLLSLDARKLKDYNSDHYDESQIDNMLEEARLEGYTEGHEGKRLQIGTLGKIAIAFIVIAVIGVVVVIGLQGGL